MKKLLTLLTGASFITGCYYDNNEDLYPTIAACDTANVSYSGSVLSIISNNCYSCHGAGIELGNVNLEGYANLKTYADNGKLIGTIRHSDGYSAMPQGGNKLSDCNISSIQKWINDGTPNN